MNALQYKDLLINFTSEFIPLWNDRGSGVYKSISFWRPATSADPLSQFFPLGDIAVEGYRNINQQKVVAVVSDANKVDGTALRSPDEFELVWKDAGSGARTDFSLWRPLPPEGYVSMGLVCGVGYDKPSRNAVRCVREDLVMAARTGQLIWTDKGSGAPMDFSAWGITPADAAPGEINLAPGTFIGTASYAKPITASYSLRLPLTADLKALPKPPSLSGYTPPATLHTLEQPQLCQLPWFTVKDPDLNPVEQLQTCPMYRLERIDHYLFVGFGHNQTATSQPFMWTATKGETGKQSRALTATTSIELCSEWPSDSRAFELSFSAHLGQEFTHCQRSAKGWADLSALEIITYIPANKALAAYVIQSEYRLLRGDGSQVTGTVTYTNGDNVYVSEYPASEPVHRDEPPVETPVEQPVEPPAEPDQAEPGLEITPHDGIDDTLLP
ncbi:Vps62-related protein [Pseudomonas sp. MWU16-30323]|uniref:Vps62-related protein n=1 Tax=Pseudomonas sp. MWU16-30323 TaxID=2878094 RepID=UPI001CFC21EE|nr:Vps62-related protein [Pseudomonas sp. MWU16-30323]